MHMNSAPHLLIEDRPEFERVLDEALRTADRHPELAAIGQQLNAEQLRTLALNAVETVAARAADEYQHYVATRDRLRRRTPPANASPTSPADGQASESGGPFGSARSEASGAGLLAGLAVLVPVLAGAAAIIFLLVGYALRLMKPAPSIAQPMVTAGWIFAALAAVGILVAAAGLLLTAVRNGSDGAHDGPPDGQPADAELTQAQNAWRHALLERGVLPFLYEALAHPDHTSRPPVATDAEPPAQSSSSSPSAPPSSAYVPSGGRTTGRTPHLGYSRPGFSTEGESSKARPRFSSPDFSSPDYGGPEHRPD